MDLFISHSYLDEQSTATSASRLGRGGALWFRSDDCWVRVRLSSANIEQVHFHPYQPLTTIALSSRRITTSLIIWAFGLQTVAYSQVQRFHSPQYLAGFVWMNRAIQAKTRGTFSTSCRPSYWWNSFSCQSTVTATITSRTILYSAWDSALIVGTGFGHHTLRP